MWPIRSALFVPAHRRNWVGKAIRVAPGAVVLDIEDSVPPQFKPQAMGYLKSEIHELRDANRETLKSTRALETKDMNLASQNYRAAIEKISKYAFLEFEPGLVGRLLREENEEFGYNGELIALDRLTLCLIKSGKPEEASVAAQDYFSRYRRDALLSGAKKIQERIRKAIERQNRKSK